MKNIKPKYSNRLWAARKEIGYSQQEVAYLLGHKNSPQISRWEKGHSMPNTIDLLKLSAIYHRLANDLYWDLFLDLREGVNERRKTVKQENEGYEAYDI